MTPEQEAAWMAEAQTTTRGLRAYEQLAERMEPGRRYTRKELTALADGDERAMRALVEYSTLVRREPRGDTRESVYVRREVNE